MFRKLIVAVKLRPLIQRLQELCAMPLTASNCLQIFAVVLQILNLILPITTGKVKIIVATAIGIVQVILHNFAGWANPDGTPAAMPYQPGAKK